MTPTQGETGVSDPPVAFYLSLQPQRLHGAGAGDKAKPSRAAKVALGSITDSSLLAHRPSCCPAAFLPGERISVSGRDRPCPSVRRRCGNLPPIPAPVSCSVSAWRSPHTPQTPSAPPEGWGGTLHATHHLSWRQLSPAGAGRSQRRDGRLKEQGPPGAKSLCWEVTWKTSGPASSARQEQQQAALKLLEEAVFYGCFA